MLLVRIVFFFFFQAEDGIRDDLVTGVQTCALPISIDSAGVVLSRVFLRSVTAMPMPVELDLRMLGGASQHLSLPVEIWYAGSQYTLQVPGPKRVVGAAIDTRNF